MRMRCVASYAVFVAIIAMPGTGIAAEGRRALERAGAFMVAGNLGGAKGAYKAALASREAATDVWTRATALTGLARLAGWRGALDEARSLAREALALRPGDRDATLVLAEALVADYDRDAARALLEPLATAAIDDRATQLLARLDAPGRTVVDANLGLDSDATGSTVGGGLGITHRLDATTALYARYRTQARMAQPASAAGNHTATLGARWRVAAGTTLGAGYELAWADTRSHGLALQLVQRLGDRVTIDAAAKPRLAEADLALALDSRLGVDVALGSGVVAGATGYATWQPGPLEGAAVARLGWESRRWLLAGSGGARTQGASAWWAVAGVSARHRVSDGFSLGVGLNATDGAAGWTVGARLTTRIAW